MITVVHIKQHPDAVYCGRACYGLKGSSLANLYKIGRDGTREEVIGKYDRWFDLRVHNTHSSVYQEVMRLVDLARHGDLKLGCWCRKDGTNIACHCDVIKEYIEVALASA